MFYVVIKTKHKSLYFRWLWKLSPSLRQRSERWIRTAPVQHVSGLLKWELSEGMKEAFCLHARFLKKIKNNKKKTHVVSEKFLKCIFYFLPLIKDGYQQNYKRGAGQGPRGVSRSSTQAMRTWTCLLKWLWLKKKSAPHWKTYDSWMHFPQLTFALISLFLISGIFWFSVSSIKVVRALISGNNKSLKAQNTQGKLWTQIAGLHDPCVPTVL